MFVADHQLIRSWIEYIKWHSGQLLKITLKTKWVYYLIIPRDFVGWQLGIALNRQPVVIFVAYRYDSGLQCVPC